MLRTIIVLHGRVSDAASYLMQENRSSCLLLFLKTLNQKDMKLPPYLSKTDSEIFNDAKEWFTEIQSEDYSSLNEDVLRFVIEDSNLAISEAQARNNEVRDKSLQLIALISAVLVAVVASIISSSEYRDLLWPFSLILGYPVITLTLTNVINKQNMSAGSVASSMLSKDVRNSLSQCQDKKRILMFLALQIPRKEAARNILNKEVEKRQAYFKGIMWSFSAVLLLYSVYFLFAIMSS